MDSARQALGPIDILVNNAGVFRKGDLADFDFSQMDGMRNVNVDGLVRVTRAVAGDMKARRWGRIVNVTSIAGIGTSTAGTTFYAATKAAVITLTRRFALDLGPHGITVNAIAPGFIATDMAAQSGADFDAIAAKAMMRRVGTPDDIASRRFLPRLRASRFHHRATSHRRWRPDRLHRPSLKRAGFHGPRKLRLRASKGFPLRIKGSRCGLSRHRKINADIRYDVGPAVTALSSRLCFDR